MELERTEGAWITRPFNKWKKTPEKMQACSQSQGHIQSYVAAIALKGTSVTQLIHSVTDQHKMKNRMAIKALLHCTHFFT